MNVDQYIARPQISSRAMPFLWQYIKCFKFRFVIMFICMVVWAVNEATFPYFIKLMVDIIESSQPGTLNLWQVLLKPIVGLSSIWLMMEISMRVFGLIEVFLYPKFRAKIRHDLFNYIKQHGHSYFSQNLSGSIGSKVADAPRLSQAIVSNIIWGIIPISLAFVFSAIIVARVNLVFMGLMLVWSTCHFFITFYYAKEVDQKISDHYQTIAHLNGETVDIITNATAMRLFAQQDFESHRLNECQSNEISRSKRAGFSLQKVDFLRGAASLIFMISVIYFLIQGWQHKSVRTGDFPLIAFTTFNIMGLVWQMTRYITETFKEVGALNGSLSLLSSRHTVVDDENAQPIQVTQGQIVLSNVCFGYNSSHQLFKNLSIAIYTGEKIGLVGFSGSGKTSFVNLILREYDISQGSITIDDQNISQVTQKSLKQNINVIPQDPHLFNRSVLDNLRYAKADATLDECIQAAQKAFCHDFIMQLDHGYDTFVGEKGSKLSGGQRQRLSIARAMLKDTPILILDEATSALDSITEKLIQKSLMTLMKNKTVLVIAHHLKTLEMMDRILVFDQGQIVEQGTQQQLLDKRGIFHQLWTSQNLNS